MNVLPLSVSSSHIQVFTVSYGVYFLNTSQDFPSLSTHFAHHLGSGSNPCSPGYFYLLVSPNWSAHILSRLPLPIHSILWPKYPSDLEIDQVTPSYNPSMAPYCPQEDCPERGPRHDLAPSPSSSILYLLYLSPLFSAPASLPVSHTLLSLWVFYTHDPCLEPLASLPPWPPEASLVSVRTGSASCPLLSSLPAHT